MLNAAVWLGGSIFFMVQGWPLFSSPEVKELLGTGNYPYFSGALAQFSLAHFFRFQIWCAMIASVQLLAEWLYLGRPARKASFSLLALLFALALAGASVVQPRLSQLHATRFAANVPAANRAVADRAFRGWRVVTHAINMIEIAGLMIYLWRMASPSDTTRFVTSVKFHS